MSKRYAKVEIEQLKALSPAMIQEIKRRVAEENGVNPNEVTYKLMRKKDELVLYPQHGKVAKVYWHDVAVFGVWGEEKDDDTMPPEHSPYKTMITVVGR